MVTVHSLEHALPQRVVIGLDQRRIRHRVVLVVQRKVVKDVLLLGVHAPYSFADDNGQFKGEGRVVAHQVRYRVGNDLGVTVLVLQTFAVERRATGRAAEEESPAHHVTAGPDHVAHPLETENRVEDIKRNGGYAMNRVRRAGRHEGGHGPGFADPLLQDLAVGFLAIRQQAVAIHRGVLLAFGRVDAGMLEQALEAESPRLVGHDGHDVLADLRVAKQFR